MAGFENLNLSAFKNTEEETVPLLPRQPFHSFTGVNETRVSLSSAAFDSTMGILVHVTLYSLCLFLSSQSRNIHRLIFVSWLFNIELNLPMMLEIPSNTSISFQKTYLGVRWVWEAVQLEPSYSSALCQRRGLAKVGGWYSGDLHAHKVSFLPVFQQYPFPPI